MTGTPAADRATGPAKRGEGDPGAALASLGAHHAAAFARAFYDRFLEDDEGAAFLSHAAVEQRLLGSLTAWIADLFQHDDPEADQASIAQQRQIGEVHARIKLPMALVMKGAGMLKAAASRELMAQVADRATLAAALIEMNRRVDWAMALMSEAYMRGTLRRAQVDEAFRLFAVGQDVSLERESQRATLMEWVQSLLFTLFDRETGGHLKPIGSSPFGLWLHHRAPLMFQGAPGLDAIHDNLVRIDRVMLPQIEDARAMGTDLAGPLARLQAVVEEIKFVLGDLFQSVAGIEHGRDPLTRALNRRFLPTILSREITIARQTGTPFTLLMIDLDHFKRINDGWGHAAGDLVLGQTAETLADTVRLNDFVFRYGGEEFLIALVETGAREALEVAERVRARIAERDMRLPDSSHLKVTASVGVATFSGHPDYAVLVEAADRALYQAKQQGRNRVVAAP